MTDKFPIIAYKNNSVELYRHIESGQELFSELHSTASPRPEIQSRWIKWRRWTSKFEVTDCVPYKHSFLGIDRDDNLFIGCIYASKVLTCSLTNILKHHFNGYKEYKEFNECGFRYRLLNNKRISSDVQNNAYLVAQSFALKRTFLFKIEDQAAFKIEESYNIIKWNLLLTYKWVDCCEFVPEFQIYYDRYIFIRGGGMHVYEILPLSDGASVDSAGLGFNGDKNIMNVDGENKSADGSASVDGIDGSVDASIDGSVDDDEIMNVNGNNKIVLQDYNNINTHLLVDCGIYDVNEMERKTNTRTSKFSYIYYILNEPGNKLNDNSDGKNNFNGIR